MHEPAGVVEILVQILQNTPILKYISEYPPPSENENCQRSWHFDFSVSEYPSPPPRKLKFGQILAFKTFQFQNTPPPKIEIWADLSTLRLFSFRIPPPHSKIKIWADLGTLTLFQKTPFIFDPFGRQPIWPAIC